MLNNLATSDFAVSGKFQLPVLKLNNELQVVQTEESVTVHIWQLLTVHFLIVKLIIFWTGPDIPETVEVM